MRTWWCSIRSASPTSPPTSARRSRPPASKTSSSMASPSCATDVSSTASRRDARCGRPCVDARESTTVIVLVLTALLTAVPLFPVLAIPAGVAIAGLTILAWRRRQQAAASLGLFSVACVALAIAGVRPQQVLFPIAFAIYFAVVWRLPWLRRASAWLKWGSIDATIVAFAVAIAVVSGVSLLAWFAIARPDVSDLIRA